MHSGICSSRADLYHGFHFCLSLTWIRIWWANRRRLLLDSDLLSKLMCVCVWWCPFFLCRDYEWCDQEGEEEGRMEGKTYTGRLQPRTTHHISKNLGFQDPRRSLKSKPCRFFLYCNSGYLFHLMHIWPTWNQWTSLGQSNCFAPGLIKNFNSQYKHYEVSAKWPQELKSVSWASSRELKQWTDHFINRKYFILKII